MNSQQSLCTFSCCQLPYPSHSLILSSHLFFFLPLLLFPFTVPCRIDFPKLEDLETWPRHLSFRFLTRVRSSSYSPMAAWIFLQPPYLATWFFNLRILREKYLQHQQNLYNILSDFKKAFDSVWHVALWATMQKYNISANLVRAADWHLQRNWFFKYVITYLHKLIIHVYNCTILQDKNQKY